MTVPSVRGERRGGFLRFVPDPVRLRELLERQGPTFVKIGQYLALRPDLIPQEYCDELMTLFDRVSPVPWDEIRRVLREELGREPETVFSSIDPRPLAAGSLAQVHLARLDVEGEVIEVVVKVLRPGIEQRVARDLRRARRLVRLLELARVELIVAPRELVAEIAEWLRMELDFGRELANVRRLYDRSEGQRSDGRGERIPQPFPSLCGPRVLTIEYLAGVRVSDLLRAAGSAPLDVDLDQFAGNLLRSSLRQMFRYHFFHADLHPGNLILLAGSDVGFVDFGLCVELDEGMRRRQLRYISALYHGDSEQIFRSLVEILSPSQEAGEEFRKDFFALPRPSGDRETNAGRSPIADWMVEILRICRRHRLRVPARALAMYRALLMAETVAHRLGSRETLGTVGRRFFEDLRRDDFLEGFDPRTLQGEGMELARLLRDAPAQLSEILASVANERFQLPVRFSETAEVARARGRRARLLTTAVLSVGVSILLSQPHLPAVGGISVAWPLGAALLFLYVRAFALWRSLDP